MPTIAKRPKMRGGAEFDALTGWRRVYCYLRKAGAAGKIKRQYRRRWRREADAETRGMPAEMYSALDLHPAERD